MNRSQAATIGNLERASRPGYDGRKATEAARIAAQSRFEREVDPDGTMPEAERFVKAERARKAFYKRISVKATETRQRKGRRS